MAKPVSSKGGCSNAIITMDEFELLLHEMTTSVDRLLSEDDNATNPPGPMTKEQPMLSAPKKSSKRAVEIDDEDEIEERPVRRGRREEPEEIDDEDEDEAPRAKKRKVVIDEDEEDDEPVAPVKKRKVVLEEDEEDDEPVAPRGRGRKAAVIEEDEDIDPDDLEEDDEPVAPVKKRKAAVIEDDEDEPAADEDEDEAPAPRKKSRKVVDEDEDEDEAPAPKKSRKVVEEDDEEEEAPKKSAPKAPKSAAASVKNGEYILPKGTEIYAVLVDDSGRWVKGDLETVGRQRTVTVDSENNSIPVAKVKDKKGATHIVVEHKDGLYVTTIESMLTVAGKAVKIAAPVAVEEDEAPAPKRSRKAVEVEPEEIDEEEGDTEATVITVDTLTKKQKKALNAFLASLSEA